MPSPKFNNETIFDSDDGTSTYPEGVLDVEDYEAIFQTLHFNGENGDRYLSHGWPDRQWTFRGLISATSLSDLTDAFAAIQAYIDEAAEDPSVYHSLIDSYNQTYTNAQIRRFKKSPPLAAINRLGQPSYVSEVIVTGIVQGMAQDGGDA